jgi:hypothetical protein
MMLFRSSAAICGAVVALAISVTVARSEIGAVHSSAVVNAAWRSIHVQSVPARMAGGRVCSLDDEGNRDIKPP